MKNYKYNGNTKKSKITTDKEGNILTKQEEIIVDWIESEMEIKQPEKVKSTKPIK